MHGVWRFGAVGFDNASGRLLVGGRETRCDRSCRAIFAALLDHSGQPLDKDALIAADWPGRVVHENSLA